MEVPVILQAGLLSHMKQQLLLLVRVALVVKESHDSRGSRSSHVSKSRSSPVSRSRSSHVSRSRDPKASSPVSP